MLIFKDTELSQEPYAYCILVLWLTSEIGFIKFSLLQMLSLCTSVCPLIMSVVVISVLPILAKHTV